MTGTFYGVSVQCFRSTCMKRRLLFPIFKSLDPAKRGRCMHLFLSASVVPVHCDGIADGCESSIVNAASCLIRNREIVPLQILPFFFLQMKEGGKGINEQKMSLAFTI